MVLGVLPFVPLSAAAKEGAGDPPIRELRYMRGVIFPSASEGDQLLPPELGGGCHRAFLLHIHPPPINKKICLTSVNDRSTLRCTGEGTLSPLVGNPPRTALGAPNSHCSPSPTSVPSLFFGLDHRPSLCLECSPCRSLHSRPPQPFLSVSYSGKLQPPASRSSHLLAFLDFFPEHLPPSSVLAYLVYCSSSPLSIQPPIRT